MRVAKREPLNAGIQAETPRDGRGQPCPREVFVRILSCAVRVGGNCPWILRDLLSLYPVSTVGGDGYGESQLVGSVSIEHGTKDGHGYYLVREVDHRLRLLASASDTLAHLEQLVSTTAMLNLSQHLLVHAAVATVPTGGILLPGASGAGKSTLVAAFCLSGFEYLSDEVAVLERGSVSALPFLKSICLKDGGWRTVAASFEVPPPSLMATRADGEPVRYLAAPIQFPPDGRVQVRYVLLPARSKGARATLRPVSRAAVLAELARHSLNLPRHGLAGVELLARLVEGAECHILIYEDLRDAVSVVSELVGHLPVTAAQRPSAPPSHGPG